MVKLSSYVCYKAHVLKSLYCTWSSFWFLFDLNENVYVSTFYMLDVELDLFPTFRKRKFLSRF